MAGVDSDAYTSADDSNFRISEAVGRCMSRKPEYHVASKSKALRTQLNKLKIGSSKKHPLQQS